MGFKTNSIYCGDCKDVLINHIPDESIDLIYVDPPFFSNKKYEVIWGDGYELRAFEDRWKGGINNYVVWMEDKMRECHRVLKPTGSMYLHCDYHANAHLRILMDGIFGENNFGNEIIWCYTGPSQNKKDFPDKHDTIFRYKKNTKKCNFYPDVDAVRVPYSENFLERREYIEGKGGIFKGKEKYTKKNLKKGKLIEDWWSDIPAGGQISRKELLGYPTQKPEKLLERIIKASSNPTDIVLDPMCGCGTAIVVAHETGRQWIGIDISPTACKLMANRMRKLGVSISEKDIIGMPQTLEEVKAMQPFEFQNWVCQRLLARASKRKVGDMGIDGWMIDGRPLQIKQSEHVGRNVIDNFETALRRANKNQGVVVALSFGKGVYEEVARSKLQNGFDIELKTVQELLGEE